MSNNYEKTNVVAWLMSAHPGERRSKKREGGEGVRWEKGRWKHEIEGTIGGKE